MNQNTYEIEGQRFEGRNEYEALKEAYKMAKEISLAHYLEEDEWEYTVKFSRGEARVRVKKVGGYSEERTEAQEIAADFRDDGYNWRSIEGKFLIDELLFAARETEYQGRSNVRRFVFCDYSAIVVDSDSHLWWIEGSEPFSEEEAK